jgi:phosphatidylserine/phosphatidylglycerophosphate/cardiolipin synthase-like enzyme
MGQLSAFEERVLKALEPRAALAFRALQVWSELPPESVQTVKSLTEAAHLGVTEESALAEVFSAGLDVELFEAAGSGFRVKEGLHRLLSRLAFALEAIDHYRTTLHCDDTKVQVVLTKPPQPSVLEQRLEDVGWRATDLEPTDRAFLRLVQMARRRVVVMTPFFDTKGAAWLKELFSQTAPGVVRQLILRSLESPDRPDYPAGFPVLAPWFREQSVEVFNYSLSRPNGGGRETFHAKVVLCDRDAAYLGSSNLNHASLEYSMEMGIAMRGRAAAQVDDVIGAVIKASTRVL